MLHSLRTSVGAVLVLVLFGCSKSSDGSGGGAGAKAPTGGAGGTSGTSGSGGSSGSSGSGGSGLPGVPGTPDDSVDTALPPVPRLPNVTARATGDSVSISVEPVDGARDYRVYVLPNDSDVMPGSSGALTVRNATYRCAGDRQSRDAVADGDSLGGGETVKTLVDNQNVKGYRRTLADATLGHVYVKPGDGRVPVYALGDPSMSGDNSCFHQRWGASRVKRYVTAAQERTQLLSQRWRDDGAVFYVPADGAAGTKPVYVESGDDAVLYYTDGPEASQRGTGSRAFSVLTAEVAGETLPLMRVHYDNGCGDDHDELVPGASRFARARYQGDELPDFELHWSGITRETTLVVEALDVGCPFQGVLTPVAAAASTDDAIEYPPFLTIDDVRAASTTGEVFVNGQHEASNTPRPIARSFIKIAPGPRPDLDWFAGFGSDETIPDFMAGGWNAPCENPDNPNCLREYRQQTDFADIMFTSATPNRNGIAAVLGELWVTYADVGADVGGKFRLTPNARGTMSESTFLHVTMEVDAVTTTRRYPQILISDGSPPVQWNLANSNTLILQTFPDDGTANWPYLYQLEICDHRVWDVNNQCPVYDFYRVSGGLAAAPEVGEHTGVDRSTTFDAFLSTRRAYLLLDNQPYGCVDLPSSGVPSGMVTVTFGDVIYHSGVDETLAFQAEHQQLIAKRHFDNLGFKSGVAAPPWDAARFPCISGTR